MATKSQILHRSLTKAYPTAAGGGGVYLVTKSGQKILDGSSGAAVSSLGHGNKEVIDAIVKQAQSLAFAHTSFFTSDPAEELSRFIISHSDGAFSRLIFLTSGSEAVESALKVARQYHVYNGQPERVNIIGRVNSYHGNTIGALAAGNNPPRRDTFSPFLSDAFHHVSRCFYDADGAGLSEREYEDRLIAEIEGKFKQLGPETVAAVIVESVGGATLGSVPATSTYLPRLKQLCERSGALVIFDEVMCGMGRCGTYHAWQSLGGVAPDIQTIGKGLGAGYQPLSAVLLAPKIADRFEKSAKQPFISGHTFQGHSMACASSLTVQNILFRDRLLENVCNMGEQLKETLLAGLPPQFKQHGGSMRGMGLFRTVDFGTMGSHLGGPLAAQVAEETFKRGVAVYLCSSVVDAILFAPPFIISADEIAILAQTFLDSVRAVMANRQRARL